MHSKHKHRLVLFAVTTSLLITTVAVTPGALALPIDQIPNPRQTNGWVSDTAKVLTPAEQDTLNQLIEQVHHTTGDELALVTVAEAAPFSTCKEAATNLFNTWHIGQAGKNNGLLTLVCLKEHRVEQETGYGLEGMLPDLLLKQLQQQHLVSAFKQQHYGSGLIADQQAISQILLGKSVPTLQATQDGLTAEQQALLVAIIVLVIVLLVVLIIVSKSGGSGGSGGSRRSGSSSYWSDSSSSSDSGSSWGGGDSGGGGAGSGW